MPIFKKKELILLSKDRLALLLIIVLALGVLILLTMTFFSVHSTDIQVPVRYSGYGFTNLYRDKWYNLLSFAIFGLVAIGTNAYLAIKLHAQRRGIAIGILMISALIIVLAIIIANAIFRLAAFSL